MAYAVASSPPAGEAIEIAPGVRWLHMPLPFVLDHINLW
ncbi:MAG: Zn-dependent hydrolase, partial [Rhodocyclales bacterium CG_4_10_14_3_um_filter_68_10]